VNAPEDLCVQFADCIEDLPAKRHVLRDPELGVIERRLRRRAAMPRGTHRRVEGSSEFVQTPLVHGRYAFAVDSRGA
jgi:hypothetical protein